MDERGSVGILFVAVLALLCAGLTCVSLYVGRAGDYGRRVEAREAGRARLRAAIDGAVEELAADATPESDGPRDAVWAALGGREDGVVLSLEDLSSRLNANFTPVELLGETPLLSCLAPGASPESLREFREGKGLSTEIGHYAGILAEDSPELWSCFGWANVNTVEPSSLRALFLSLTGSEEGAEAFSLRVAAARIAKRTILPEGLGPDTLGEILGSSFPVTYPVICAQAPHNANFASAYLIGAILSYQPFGIAEPAARAETIVAAREDHDLSEGELASILGTGSGGARIDGQGNVLQYLGVRTWFWLLKAEADGRSYSAVVAAWPSEAGDSAAAGTAADADGADITGAGSAARGAARTRRLAIVETRFEP